MGLLFPIDYAVSAPYPKLRGQSIGVRQRGPPKYFSGMALSLYNKFVISDTVIVKASESLTRSQ